MAFNTLNIITSVIFQTLSYLTVPTLMVLALITNSGWLNLARIMSTILTSTISSHMENADENNILMQFFFWLAEWGMVFWFYSRCPCAGACRTIDIFLHLLKVLPFRPRFRTCPMRSGWVLLSSGLSRSSFSSKLSSMALSGTPVVTSALSMDSILLSGNGLGLRGGRCGKCGTLQESLL